MTWDRDYFYIAAELLEPHVWGTLTKHDSVIFHDNDFEVFLDPDSDSHRYGEFEINALNTGWDLFLPKPYKDGGKADNSWELPGLKTAIHVDGTLNDPTDTDRGWSVEIALPWQALARIAGSKSAPEDGSLWRVNFSRVEWQHDVRDGQYQKRPGLSENNWVWSPQHVINMHRPETWGYVQFTTRTAPGDDKQPTRATLDKTSQERLLMSHLYYLQREYRREHQRYSQTLAPLIDQILRESKVSLEQVTIEADDSTFRMTVPAVDMSGQTGHISITHDGRLRFVAQEPASPTSTPR